jgi:dihydrofolate reductase
MSGPAKPGDVVLIVAVGQGGVIGADGGLPWRIPEDLQRFKQLTMGKPVVMGRRTFESLAKALPGRRNIVLTRDHGWSAPDADVAHDAESALWIADPDGTGGEIAVIGGAEIYALFEPLADRIELTEVHAEYQGDTFVAPLDPARWEETARRMRPAMGERPAFDFVTLVRRRR